jgi:hypothetical protein
MLRLVMTPISEIQPSQVRGVVYLHRITKGQVDGVKFYMVNGDTHLYEGDDLAAALALAKERFADAEPGSERIGDNGKG